MQADTKERIERAKGDLPLSFEAFTAQWFEDILQAQFPGAKVSSINSTDKRIGTSASCRFEIEYSDKGNGDTPPPSLYVKGGFTEEQRKRYWTVLQQEALFYQEFADDIPLQKPHCFFAAMDDETKQGIVVLEDLALRDITFGFWGGLSVDQVADLLEQMGNVHGKWQGDPRLDKLRGFEQAQRGFSKYCLRDKHWEELLTRSYGAELKEASGDAETLRIALDRMWEHNDAQLATWVHGDLHGWNTIFDKNGRAGAIDFQLCYAGAPVVDAAWLMQSGLSVEDRRSDEKRLLNLYRDAAISAGAQMPSEDELWQQYREQGIHSILNGACNPKEGGPMAAHEKAAEVSLAVAIDLDSVGALGLSR